MSTLPSRGRRALGAVALSLLGFNRVPPGHAAPDSDWAIDPAQTHIVFSIDAIGYPRTQGEFHRFDGHISIDFDHPERSRVNFEVEARSVDVGSEAFDAYLRSEALLDAARFATIAFASTAVRKVDASHVAVVGALTMLGVTRPVTVDVAVRRQAGQAKARLSFTAQAKIDRLDFGMSSGFPIVSRLVDLTVESEVVAP